VPQVARLIDRQVGTVWGDENHIERSGARLRLSIEP
jgi:hypothetical protein